MTEADRPTTSYVRAADGTHIAYQVVGEGPVDLVIVPGFISHLDLDWEDRRQARLLRRLASFCRLIRFDKPGTGLSDRDTGVRPLEQRMDDLRVLLDATGSDKTVLFGISEGGPMSILFAATYPERTAALVLYGTLARSAPAPGYDVGDLPGRLAELRRVVDTSWGRGDTLRWLADSLVGRPEAVERWATWERSSASPGSASAILDLVSQIDVRTALGAVSVPTLVIHRRDDDLIDESVSRFVAANIPGAEWWAQAGEHLPTSGDVGELAERIELFVTGETNARRRAERVLATVLFSDIVGSTQRAADIGDERWRELLDDHDQITRDQVTRFDGRVVKTTGDGLLATFDGPGKAVRCALTLPEALSSLGLEVRSGVHTGEVELRGADVGGIAVHIGARVAAAARPSEVLVSSTVKDLVVGSGIVFDGRGSHLLKGVPDEWQLYAAVSA